MTWLQQLNFHALCPAVGAILLLLAPSAIAAAAEQPRAETFEVLTVGGLSYTNVTVQNKTKTDLFISHDGGIANIKIKQLDKSSQLQLGYQLETSSSVHSTNRELNQPTFSTKDFSVPAVPIDPRLEEYYERALWEGKEALKQVKPLIIQCVLGGLAVLYLLFCNCCRLLCRRAGHPANFLIWLPVLKQFPLLKAAGMKGWWFLTHLLPPLPVLAYILWCFKITKVRSKTPLTAWMLLLPVTNLFAFLYLAFTQGEGDEDPDERNTPKPISLNTDSKRDAA